MIEAKKSLRVGAGAGFAGDRISPALKLAENAELDFLVFECLAERTIALAQLRMQRGEPGYDPLLETRIRTVLPACRRNSVRIITNMGAADPRAAARRIVEIARGMGLSGLRVACVEGDNVLAHLDKLRRFNEEEVPRHNVISANAYLGADALLEALSQKADVIVTGRVADPSLFVAPMVDAFGWSLENWDLLGASTCIGHLLECAGQLTGGYFADPPLKLVPGLAKLGFPYAEIEPSGVARVCKLATEGGLINLQTCREQLLYEVMDPSRYLTPDVTADFSGIHLDQVSENSVGVRGARGTERPRDYKVSVGVLNGSFGEAQISYAGYGALQRAELARDILAERLKEAGHQDAHYEFIGLNSMHGAASTFRSEPYEVRLRATKHFNTSNEALLMGHEVESLYVNGPAGGAGVSSSVRESVAIFPALIDRECVSLATHLETV